MCALTVLYAVCQVQGEALGHDAQWAHDEEVRFPAYHRLEGPCFLIPPVSGLFRAMVLLAHVDSLHPVVRIMIVSTETAEEVSPKRFRAL